MTWRIVSQPAGPGYVCVGDAAAVLDPASSHGVLKGLMSGMMAGHVIAQAESGTASIAAATEAYSAWLREWFRADARELRRMYRELPTSPAVGSRAPGFLRRADPARSPVADRSSLIRGESRSARSPRRSGRRWSRPRSRPVPCPCPAEWPPRSDSLRRSVLGACSI